MPGLAAKTHSVIVPTQSVGSSWMRESLYTKNVQLKRKSYQTWHSNLTKKTYAKKTTENPSSWVGQTKTCLLFFNEGVTPPKTNMEPENDGSQRILLFKGFIFRFHVSFRGVIWGYESWLVPLESWGFVTGASGGFGNFAEIKWADVVRESDPLKLTIFHGHGNIFEQSYAPSSSSSSSSSSWLFSSSSGPHPLMGYLPLFTEIHLRSIQLPRKKQPTTFH